MKKYLSPFTVIIAIESLFAQTAPAYSSLAIGTNTTASGQYSFASGNGSKAIGHSSVALGQSIANGNNAVALGNGSADANNSFAAGYNTRATGQYSTALGYAVTTNAKVGSFIIGDAVDMPYLFGNDANNQMMMKFLNGYKFYVHPNNLPLSINANGTVGIDQSNLNNGTINGGLIFGGGSGEGIASRRTGGANQYGLDFYTSFANRMSITNGGNLGLGTLTPTARFSLGTNGEELLGTAPSKIFKTYSGVLGTNAGAEIKLASFGFKSGNWTSLGITAYRFNGADGWQNAAILFGYDVDNTPGAGSYFALAGNGNFGIGTAAPGAKLHVMGNIIATGNITPSDIRYKKDIHPLNGALKKIMALSGYSYSFRSSEFPNMQFDSKLQVGLIAQEVENVLPQIVYTTQNGYKGVDYVKIIPLLIEGIKDQQQMIEKQQMQIDELRKMVVILSKK
jgi:hypothetical protein